MTDFIKRLTKEEKEEKKERAALLYKEREEKEKTEEKKIEYIKRKKKIEYIKKKKKHWIKKKPENLDKVIAEEVSKDTLFAGGGAVKGNRGMGAALRGGGRAFLKGGKV